MEPLVESEPFVKHMGLFYEMIEPISGLGYKISHSMDLGLNYKIPYYSDRQYHVLGADISLHAGMFQWLEIITPFLSASIHIEVNGAKIVPSLRLLYDIATYTDACASFDIASSGLEIVVTGSIDYKDCNVGAFGSIYELLMYSLKSPSTLGSALDCEKRSFWFDKKPIYRVALDNIVKEWWSTTVLKETCLFNKEQV